MCVRDGSKVTSLATTSTQRVQGWYSNSLQNLQKKFVKQLTHRICSFCTVSDNYVLVRYGSDGAKCSGHVVVRMKCGVGEIVLTNDL